MKERKSYIDVGTIKRTIYVILFSHEYVPFTYGGFIQYAKGKTTIEYKTKG